MLGAATAQLCKAMIMENTKVVDLTAEAAAAQGRVKYACVVLQYDGPKLNKEKMTHLVRKMEGKAVGKKQYNMRMVSEEANLTLSGFEHNAVTPIGMAQRMPIIVSRAARRLRRDAARRRGRPQAQGQCAAVCGGVQEGRGLRRAPGDVVG